MKTILTLFLSLLTILSFSASDTAHVYKTFRNDRSRMKIEFISFRDSIGQMTSRVKLPIECDSLVLNLKNSLWSGIGLNKLDKIGFITPDHFRKSNFSNVSSIVVYIGGSSHIFKSNVVEDNVYFHSNLPPIELTPGDLLVQAGREKNIAIGLYTLSAITAGLLATSPNADYDGIIVTSGFIFVIGVGCNISGNMKISKAGELMNRK